MALKDWKKDEAGKDRIFFDRKRRNGIKEHVIDIFKDGKKWKLHVLFNYNTIESEQFKTKSQALAYAKSYMRTH